MSLAPGQQTPGKPGVQMVSFDGITATFRACISNVTPAATPSDIFQLIPGTNKTVRIKRYKVTGFATTAGFMPFRVERRSTANTGGKEVTWNAVGGSAPALSVHDSSDPASDVQATGKVSYYSSAAGNPTATGTVKGVLDAGRLSFPSVTVGLGNALSGGLDEIMTQDGSKAFVFRGAADIFAINLTGAAVPSGGVFDLMVEWEETVANDAGNS